MNDTVYKIVRERAGILDLADHRALQVTGPQRVPFLHNLLSNDIKNLPIGGRSYAMLLTRAGRVVADLNVYALEESLLLEATRSAIEQAFPVLKKMILFSKVEVREASPDIKMTSLQGPEAERLAALAPAGLKKFPNDRTGLGGIDWIGNPEALKKFAAVLIAQGIPSVDPETFEVLRIEAGIPLFGPELNEDVVPLEAGLEATAISFTKGCYTGQEVIARIRTYGEIAKKLVGLKLDRPARAGDRLYDGEVEAGWITSAADSPKAGGPVALGYCRRGSWDLNTGVVVKTKDGEVPAIVSALPFTGNR